MGSMCFPRMSQLARFRDQKAFILLILQAQLTHGAPCITIRALTSYDDSLVMVLGRCYATACMTVGKLFNACITCVKVQFLAMATK